MIQVSEHHFRDADGDISVAISEVIEEAYGLYVWPCSIVLAEYVWQQRNRFRGVQVLELGAGTALPGIVAAKVGAHVTLTDLENNKVSHCHDSFVLKEINAESEAMLCLHYVLSNMRKNCEENAVKCKIAALTWGDWTSNILDSNPDILLGADVFYSSSDFDDLLATVAFLLRKNPGAVFISAYEPRSGHRSIELLMVKWKLQCTKLLDGHGILPSEKHSLISSSVEIVEIKSIYDS